MKYELDDVAFNQDLITINGITLYEYNEWLTDSNMVFNKYCVDVENCTIKPLEEKLGKNYIEPVIKRENLLNIITDENEIIDTFDIDYIGYNIYKTKTKYVAIDNKYHEIFNVEDLLTTFYKDDKIYFFSPLYDRDNKEIEHLMFIGIVMVCQVSKDIIKNAIAINKFYDNLVYPKRDLIASEYNIKTFEPSGTITKPEVI